MHLDAQTSRAVTIVIDKNPPSPRTPQSDLNQRKIVEFASHCDRIPQGHWRNSEKHHVRANSAADRLNRFCFCASGPRLERCCASQSRAHGRLPYCAEFFRAKEQPLVLSNGSDVTAEVLVLTCRQRAIATSSGAHCGRNDNDQTIAIRTGVGPAFTPAGR
jgi:hypothetical protein